MRDHDVTVVAPRMPGAEREEVVHGVRVRRVAYFPSRWEGLASDAIMPTLRSQWWRVVEAPFLLAALLVGTWREVRRRRPAVLNPHWVVPAGLVALLVGAVLRVPYVVTVHGADAYTMRRGPSRLIKRVVLARAAATLPVSADIGRTVGRADSPVLRMGVDVRAVQQAVGPRRVEPDLLVFVGRLADKKGLDVLIRALEHVPTARVEVIGDGPERTALVRLAERCGVSERIEFRGRQPRHEVFSAMGRARAVVIPSKVAAGGDMEGTPVVMCEAMAAGVPVVASNLGGLGECVEDGVTGLLVRPDDVGSLAASLNKVMTGSVDLEALGRAAADEATRSLDVASVGAEYDRVFAAVADR